MKVRKMGNPIGFFSKIALTTVLPILLISCKLKDSGGFLAGTSWYLNSTVGHFPNKDTIITNTYWLEKIRRFRSDGIYEKCEFKIYSCIICEPFEKNYGDLAYPHISWSVIRDTLITPSHKYKILQLSEDSLVLSFKNRNIKYTEVWKRIEI
ncbi:MAG: hypothetical protein KF870_04225 [Leadbetterella sp.]|nr:hypothetical protein [Leadbetterella sp.]